MSRRAQVHRKGKASPEADRPSIRKAAPHQPTLARRFVASTGAPLSDADAAVYGPELVRIAKANDIDHYSSLDKRLVFDVVEAEPANPLRAFVYNSDDTEAARSHRIDRCGLLIRSIQYVPAGVAVGKRAAPMPLFLHNPNFTRQSEGGRERRRHVLTEDALADDPAFASVLSIQIRAIDYALRRLEHIASARPCPLEVTLLMKTVRGGVDTYFGALAKDAAAE